MDRFPVLLPPGDRNLISPSEQVHPDMAMLCPQCRSSFAQRLHCPNCGVRLVYQDARHGPDDGPDGLPASWQQTPWGRLIVGLLLAQGLYYVLRNLCTAGLLVAREEPASGVWATLTGLIVLQVLQATSVLAAGLLTGAGQRRGLLYGAVVGVWNAVFFILIQIWTGQPLTTIDLFGQPVLQVAFGALGGLVGSLIWRPLLLELMPIQPRKSLPSLAIRKGPSVFRGPVAWGRVLTGITVAVGGVFWVDMIRDSVMEASEGKLRIDTQLQADLVTWEISALAMLAGGALAGATTRNGAKQGLCVGIGTGTVLSGIRLASITHTPELLLLTLVSALTLAFVGGWFGSHLLPPVYRSARRKRVSTALL
jgi:hypothetical protein